MEGFGGEAFIGFARSPSPPPRHPIASSSTASPSHPSLAPSSHSLPARSSAAAGASRSTPTGPRRHDVSLDGRGRGDERQRDDRDGRAAQRSDNGQDGGNKKRKREAGSDQGGSKKKGVAQRDCPWAEDVDWDACKNPAQMLNAEIDAYYRFIAPTKAEFEVRLLTIEQICRTIKREWPRADVKPFGSWQTQLYLPEGDIDLVVTNDALPPGSIRFKGFLRSMAQALRKANIADSVVVIDKAKVPIIKFVTIDGRIHIDISVNQTNGLSAANIVNTYLNAYPGARQLIMVVKALLSQRGLNEVFNGGLGSYSIICLVISFLQIHPKIQRDHINPEQNLGVLLMEFFELYGRNFYYDVDGISLVRGGSYFQKARKGFYNATKPFLLSIEDPQQPGHDISVGSFQIRNVRQAFSGAHDMLQASLFERVEIIAARRSGRVAARWVPSEMSILSAIMGAKSEMLRHRQRLLEVYTSNRLRTKLSIHPKADLSLHVSNFRKPHVIAPWTAAGASASTSASGSGSGSASAAASGSVSMASVSSTTAGPSHTRFDSEPSRASSSNAGLGAVMMDDHDTSRPAGEYSSSDDDEVEDDTGPRRRSGARSDKPVAASGRTSRAVQESDSSGNSDFMIISPPRKDGTPTSALQARMHTQKRDGRRGGREAKTREKSMNERFESVSHDEDDYEVYAERHFGSGASGSGSAAGSDMQMDSSNSDEGESRYSTSDRQASKSQKRRRLDAAAAAAASVSARAGTTPTSESESDSDIEYIETPRSAAAVAPARGQCVASASRSGGLDASPNGNSMDGGGAGLSIKGRAQGHIPVHPTDSFIPAQPQGQTVAGSSISVPISSTAIQHPPQQTSTTASTVEVTARDAHQVVTAQEPEVQQKQQGQAQKSSMTQVSKKDRRDFWAAKASSGADGDQDEFADGAEYVSFS